MTNKSPVRKLIWTSTEHLLVADNPSSLNILTHFILTANLYNYAHFEDEETKAMNT